MDGAARRIRREHNQTAWLAWHIEALARVKKLPELNTLIARDKSRRKTWQEQLALVMGYDAAINARRH